MNDGRRAQDPLPVLPGRAGGGSGRLSPLQAQFCGAQPGRSPAGGHPAGGTVYRGGDAEPGRGGHPLPGCGEPGPLPGDHQGIFSHHPVGGAGQRLAAAPQARQRSAAQDHPDGFCGPVPLDPADHPRHRPGSGAGCGGGQQHRLCGAGKPRRHPPGPVAGQAEKERHPRGRLRHAAAGVQRGGGHAPGGAGAPGHLPGKHPGAGQWPGPADRLRHHRPADRGQRPPRPAVRGLLRPRAVFGARALCRRLSGW